MAALRTPSGGRPLARRFWAFALAVACVGQAVFVGLFGRPKRAGEARLRWTPIFAGKAPEIRPEPDFGADFAKALKEGLGLNEAYEQQELSAAQRVTPIDRLFGWDRGIIASRDELDPFMDSMAETNYVTVSLDKPMGLDFVENSEEGNGVMIDKVAASSHADATGLLRAGYHLIFVNGKPVHGLSFDEAIEPIVEAEGKVQLTFFTGEAEYFYGEWKPEEDWLEQFRQKIMSGSAPEDEEQ